MSELTLEIAADVVAACQAGAEEAAGALGRSLDNEFTLAVGEPSTYAPQEAPEGFDGAGLVVLLKFGEVGLAAILPESSGLLPDWYANPDPTGESKLSTLAQELSMLLVPETLLADAFEAARVDKLSEALSAAGVAENAALATLELQAGDASAQLSLIWPLSAPDLLFPAPDAAAEAASPEGEASEAASPEGEASVQSEGGNSASVLAPNRSFRLSQLPGFSRSLLKVEVPVRVVLATKTETVREVVELVPGSIIKFDKACDELLCLHVGDQQVAEGEAVKIGDKFGFRIHAMLMPEEHFLKVQQKNAG